MLEEEGIVNQKMLRNFWKAQVHSLGLNWTQIKCATELGGDEFSDRRRTLLFGNCINHYISWKYVLLTKIYEYYYQNTLKK